ncbi:MAG: hypothetical protein OXH96_03535 [Spirochaetaceae bacterium]|nr:hypothetical protein [Spirochaetaceae bacterium]
MLAAWAGGVARSGAARRRHAHPGGTGGGGERRRPRRDYSEPLSTGDVRCDLHPHWHPDGRSLTIDAVPDGNRQIYWYDVSSIVG